MSSELRQIKARVPTDFKARWQAKCASVSLSVNNALILAMSRFMADKTGHAALRFVAISESPDRMRHRQEIRLSGSEIHAIDKLAQAAGVSRRNYIVNLVRHHLLQAPQLGMTELVAIGESNKQLAAIRSLLNQIAKKLNSGDSVEVGVIASAFGKTEKAIHMHLPHVHQVMRSNLDRWAIVEASSDDD